MIKWIRLHSVLTLTILSAVTGIATLRVGQYPDKQNKTRGANVTFFCTFPFAQDTSRVRVNWWKEGERSFLQERSDSRYQFEIRNKASASFLLLDVDVPDSGVYYCRVNKADKVGNGTGTRLLVTAPPYSPHIVPTLFGKGSALFLRLACNAGSFHSQELSIRWSVNGTEFGKGTRTDIQPGPGKLFQHSSYLEQSQPVQNGTVYTCRVSSPNNRMQTHYTYIASAGGKRRKTEKRCVQEKQHMHQAANHKMAYTAEDFNKLAQNTKYQQMEKRKACPHPPPRNQQRDDKVIYATPPLKQYQGRKMGRSVQ
ncbi:tyrosine-protein phosphatase non-receptor type substrate 1-like isoform X2 [Scyliorhinus torazame]|uniref:tyrosine-protein phosphatase non-receptor type substrate 1-like isoform X2 n=1 Tax=Scyliorhinus torazame TaxID=75743 RepID=UPI003B5B2FAF